MESEGEFEEIRLTFREEVFFTFEFCALLAFFERL